MTTQNLPAVRTTTAVAIAETTPEPAPPPATPDPVSWYLLAMTTGIFAGSAAWAQMWPVAAGLGATGIALGVAGVHVHRGEHAE